MDFSIDPDSDLKKMIVEARQKLREAAGELTEGEKAEIDRQKRANDFKSKLATRLGGRVAFSGLRLEAILVGYRRLHLYLHKEIGVNHKVRHFYSAVKKNVDVLSQGRPGSCFRITTAAPNGA
jgi:hypothetical protein